MFHHESLPSGPSWEDVKRLLAYSSISHAGYMLLGLIAGNDTGITGIEVYILVYSFMNLGAFLVVIAMRRKNIIGEDLDDMATTIEAEDGFDLARCPPVRAP